MASHNIHYAKNILYKKNFKTMAKVKGVEFVTGHSEKNGGYDWVRCDIYFEAVDGGDPVRLGTFVDARTARLIGLKPEECRRKS